MPIDVRLYLDDILESITKIRDYTDGMDFDAFTKDLKTQYHGSTPRRAQAHASDAIISM